MALRNTKEAAARLSVKPNTLEIWRVRGEGPRFVKLGRAVRYDDPDLDAYIEACKRGNTSEGRA